jgi:hypothetical protein
MAVTTSAVATSAVTAVATSAVTAVPAVAYMPCQHRTIARPRRHRIIRHLHNTARMRTCGVASPS